MLGFCQLNFFKFIIKVKRKGFYTRSRVKANFDYLKNNQLLKMNIRQQIRSLNSMKLKIIVTSLLTRAYF